MKNNYTHFYAVRNGRNPGIYNTKEDCERQISGFSGAEYQKCQTWQEARDYIFMTMVNPVCQPCEKIIKCRISQPLKTNKRKLREEDKEDRVNKLVKTSHQSIKPKK
jgi:viroplasmin and RNaseH domain-containing protein